MKKITSRKKKVWEEAQIKKAYLLKVSQEITKNQLMDQVRTFKNLNWNIENLQKQSSKIGEFQNRKNHRNHKILILKRKT